MSTGVQQPSARLCFFIAGLLYLESNSYSFRGAYCRRHTRSRPERAIGSRLASRSGRFLEQTRDSDRQLALIHPRHIKPSRSPINHLKIGGRRCPDSCSGCCHNLLRMSRGTVLFSFVPQLIPTLCILSLTHRSPVYCYGHLNCVIGIVLATCTFHTTHLPILPFTIQYFMHCKAAT